MDGEASPQTDESMRNVSCSIGESMLDTGFWMLDLTRYSVDFINRRATRGASACAARAIPFSNNQYPAN